MSNDPAGEAPVLEEDLHAYVDHALPPARRREVEAYLASHPDAAREVGTYTAHRQALRDMLAPVTDEPLPPGLNLARLVAAHQDRRHWIRGVWGMAATVLLALGMGGSAGWWLRGAAPYSAVASNAAVDAGVASLAREATASYAVYAADAQRPVEMGPAQRAELVQWISTRLGRKVAVPDMADAGYRFIGGRLVATGHGPAGMFLYEDAAGTRLSLLVRPMEIDKDTPMQPHTQGTFNGYAWADQGLGYGVVGTPRVEALHPLADEMRRQIGLDLKG